MKSVNDLDFDENGKLTSHNLVYPSGNPACPAAAHRYYGYEAHAVDDDALNLIFPDSEIALLKTQHNRKHTHEDCTMMGKNHLSRPPAPFHEDAIDNL